MVERTSRRKKVSLRSDLGDRVEAKRLLKMWSKMMSRKVWVSSNMKL